MATESNEEQIEEASPSNDTSIPNNELMTQDLQDLLSSLTVVSKELEQEFAAPERQKQNLNWKAAAVGGLFSLAANAHQKTTPQNLFGRAVQAAQASAQNHQKERAFHAEDMQLQYVAGDAAKAKNLGFVIHGFMTADEDEKDVSAQWQAWAETLDMVLYRVCWPTGSKDGWKTFADKAFQKKKSTTNNNATMNINADWVSQLTSNPWHVAQDKTIQVGAVMARFLERPPESLKKYSPENGGTVTLIGHSLGAAIVFQTLLQSSASVMVDHAIFLGGAFVPRVDSIHKVLDHIRGKYVNVYSKEDRVLKVVFRAANVNANEAAGNIPLLITKQIADEKARRIMMDMDMTDHIPAKDSTIMGHSYVEVLPLIAEKLKDVLGSPQSQDTLQIGMGKVEAVGTSTTVDIVKVEVEGTVAKVEDEGTIEAEGKVGAEDKVEPEGKVEAEGAT